MSITTEQALRYAEALEQQAAELRALARDANTAIQLFSELSVDMPHNMESQLSTRIMQAIGKDIPKPQATEAR